ncbi:hypothetical protein GobsT_69550 [Gemmata obscuriglobus]|uniref:Uncharacterized protein n=1 Tax=Gemmata obscuriglobus TaxID=114 RepID=A0A2Z3H883_9BACT|nr:hypothetical protein [Gemmata obscuriglobus]AWM41918.1 hypothetical protein C1280_36280 [Gemmata obscuriglobus]QEG32104.1 hypothetical protein GobsT_69550 [Gemmata obscuriglobus]VTS11457.1 unnamed protein product [Gemmata obscuriglobus UQM 2246]
MALAALTVAQAAQASGNYGPALGLGAAALLCLCVGFWTGGAATSFRKVVETRNEDVWHLMKALGSLRAMYSLLRTLIFAALTLAAVGLGLVGFALLNK